MTERSIPKLLQGQSIMRPDGMLESWFVDAWNDLVDRSGGETVNYVANIINGTQDLSDVVVSGVNLTSRLESIDTNVETAAAEAAVGSGGITISLSTSAASDTITGAGTLTAGPVVVTASGGTAPYTYAVAKVSGDTISYVHSGASSNTVTFSEFLASGFSKSGVYNWTVTDSTGGTPLTATRTFTVSMTALDFSRG